MAIIIINAIRQLNMPRREAKASGAVEKAKIPSSEYENNLLNDQAVVPAALSTFSYSIYLTLNPTQLKIPFEKRLFFHRQY